MRRPISAPPVKAATRTSTTSANTAAGLPNVGYVRHELLKMLPKYKKITDCMEGEQAVKERNTEYLPKPNPTDESEENSVRYEHYLFRAVFYPVTFRTIHALVGQIFLRDPQVTLPTSFDPIKLDANGENVSLDQIAELTAMHTLSLGRAALHVDYTTAPSGGVSMAAIDTGDYRPVINEHSGANVRNWRKARRGARMVYTLVVIAEEYMLSDDGFEAKTSIQYKVLRLVTPQAVQNYLVNAVDPETYGNDWDNAVNAAVSEASDVYMMEVWRSDGGDQNGVFYVAPGETYFPKDNDGKFLNEIPFQFVGSEKNDDTVDQPPAYGLSNVNLAHYRNSADYEESVFLLGQPTPWVTGVDKEWNDEVLKGNIQLGSRGVIVLPVGGAAGLIQAQPNTLAYEAMQQKERQMVALGAKLVEQRETQRTATEAEMESTADTSILAKIAKNVSSAMEWALKTCCKFTGDDPASIKYVLNKEFDLTKMPADARQQLLLEWQAGMIPFTEMRANLRRGGVATLDDATAKTLIDKDTKERQDNLLQLAAAQAINLKPVNSPPPPGSTGNSPGNTKSPPGAKPNSKPSPQPASGK